MTGWRQDAIPILDADAHRGAVSACYSGGYVLTLPNSLTFDEPLWNDIAESVLVRGVYAMSVNAYHTAVPYQPTSFQEPMFPAFLMAVL